MAHHNAMNTGVMLTSLKNYECASSLKGKTSNGDGVGKYEHELKLDLSRPLGEVLDSIFSLRGRVIIDFPGASYEQVKEYADHITKMVTCKPTCSSCEVKERADSTKMVICKPTCSSCEDLAHFPDIKVQLVEVLTRTVPEYMSRIKKIMQKYRHFPTVETVKLVTESESEVLTVNDETYSVYYKRYTPDKQELDDTSIFLKVLFEARRISPSNLIIWINLKTLLPIARQQVGNTLYSIAPNTNILPAINTKSVESPSKDASSDPFYWLGPVVQDLERYKNRCLFREHGDGGLSVIYPLQKPPRTFGSPRISKAADRGAVISRSSMRFSVHHYDFQAIMRS